MKYTIAADLHIVVNDAVRVDHRPFNPITTLFPILTPSGSPSLAETSVSTMVTLSADKPSANVRIFGNDGGLVPFVSIYIE